jgi:hypothetical protein
MKKFLTGWKTFIKIFSASPSLKVGWRKVSAKIGLDKQQK